MASSLPPTWHAPTWWLPGALCIHHYEGAWDSIGHGRDANGRPLTFYGGMQFTLATWRSVGGVTRPDRSAPREQLYRAWLVWTRDSRSWREWPNTSRTCGLG